VEIFDDQEQGLVQTLAQQQPRERLERATAPELGVHLLQSSGGIRDRQQGQ